MQERDFDIIVYGATGFVGRRAVRYLADVAAKAKLRWAIAGRSAAKIDKLAATLDGVPVFVAEANDVAAIDAFTGRTRVVLAMAGPFSLYADHLVESCVRLGTHYADITGETPWIKTLIERFHEPAHATGTRIVPSCGFDSVPSDIGAFFLARAIQRECGEDCTKMKAFFRGSGGLNGGTLATMLLMFGDPKSSEAMRDPDLLTPPEAAAGAKAPGARDPSMALFDGDAGAWVAPFVMGPINTRVVRRSAGLFSLWNEPYGKDFSYQEYMSFPGPLGAALATTVAAGTLMAQASAAFAPTRSFLEPFIPKPGTGPAESAIEGGWYRCELFARSADGRQLSATMRDSGDPGNAATVKFACEAALALALETDALPGGAERGGLLTPATAIGEVLVRRLQAAGTRFELTIPA